MLRYLRLYAYCIRFSVSKSLEFRLDFFFRIVMDLIFYTVNLGFFLVVLRHTRLIGGWNEDQVLVFVAGYLLIDALMMTLVSNNLWWLPYFVNRGDLDYYLVRPVSPLFFLSLRDFAVNSFVNLLFAVGILIWALGRYPSPLGAGRIALFCLLLVNGCFLNYIGRLIFITPVLWTHSPRGLEPIYGQLNKFSERPDGIYAGVVRVALTSVLPFCLMASFPARLLLEGLDARILLHLIAVTAINALFASWLWKKGLKAYSSASS